MNTYELLEKLSKKSQMEIELVLKELMLMGKIDFIPLSNAYVQALNMEKEDQLQKLMEAESCVMESFMDKNVKERKDTPNGRRNYNHTQRCLYLLNQSRRFNMQTTNNEFHYDPEYGKLMSCYERNKNLKI